LVNFHGKPELQKQFHKFEGNAEIQAMILYNRNKRKDIEEKKDDYVEINGNGEVQEVQET
jgi:hypothetical protein